jgi:hypothetical protein
MIKLKTILILFCALLSSAGLFAQANENAASCTDLTISQQVTELKEEFKDQGFEVIEDAMFQLNSRTDFPLIFKLQKTEFYQVVFACNENASKMKLDLIDPDQELLVSKELRPIQHTSNVISFSFGPSVSDSYTFLLSQIIKKNTCVSFTIMKLKSEADQEE